MIWTPAPSFKAADWAEAACSSWKSLSSVMRENTHYVESLRGDGAFEAPASRSAVRTLFAHFDVQALGFVMKVVHPSRLGRAQRQNSTFDSNAVPLPAFLARMCGHKLSR